jgi:Na+/H+-dicarboxylate symporter
MKRKLNSHVMFLIPSVLFAIVGYIVKEPVKVIKQLGDIFYRLLYMAGSALVFFHSLEY